MFWRAVKAKLAGLDETLITAALLCAASLPVALSLSIQTDWRGIFIWLLMWPITLIKRGWKRSLLIGAGVIPLVLFLLFQMVRPPAAEFFMLVVLVLSVCEQVQDDGRPGAFNLIGVIFPALCAMVLSTNVFLFLFLLVSVIFYTGVFTLRINDMPLSGLRIRLLPIVVALSGALFFAVAAFILMPRINPTSLPGFQQDTASSGVGEELDMGRFSDVILNGEDAFRAFVDRPLNNTDLYWRVHVLTDMVGAKWQRNASASRSVGLPGFATKLTKEHGAIRTIVRHAEAGPKWHPVLGMPLSAMVDTEAYLNPMGEFTPQRRVSLLQQQVDMTSTLDMPVHVDLPQQTQIDGQPRLRQWAQEQYAKSGSPRAFAERLMAGFAEDGFGYTLSPPRLDGEDGDKLDRFFFDTKRGYCSHYAMAMATALRAVGIPANVIIGYHGGEWNAYGGYYRVRQSDAHAWVEAELAPGKWYRFDPTQMVPSARISFDTRLTAASGVQQQDGWRGTMARAVQRVDAFIVQLNSDIILYDEAARQELLSGTVLGRLVSFVSFWLFGTLAFIAPLLAWRWWSRRDPLLRLQHKYAGLAARLGLVRAPHEGHLAFAARWAEARPEMRAPVQAFADILCRIFYADADKAAHKAELAHLLKQMQKKRKGEVKP